jgi:hypothetical protein
LTAKRIFISLHIRKPGDTRVASAAAAPKGKRMTRYLVAAAMAAALIAPSAADAASTHRHKRHIAHHGRMMQKAPVGLYGGYGAYGGYAAPSWNRTPGPPWAGPNQCFEDLGYGRYESCD